MLLFNAPNNFQPLKMRGVVIPVSDSEKHLGNFIGRDSIAKRVENAIKELYINCNKIVHEFSLTEIEIRYLLFKTYCTSFYGSPLFYYESGPIDRLFIAWRKSIRHLLKLPLRTHSHLIHGIVDDLAICVQLHKRLLKFVKSCIKSNELCSLAVKLAVNGSNSVMCRNINFICETYGLNKFELEKMYISVTVHDVDIDSDAKIERIREFLVFRDTFPIGSDDFNNLTCIFGHLCED